MEKFFALATPANIMSDTGAFLDYLAAQRDVKPGGIGTTGYCMGGLMSLTAAGTYPIASLPLPRIMAAGSRPMRRTARTCLRRRSRRESTSQAPSRTNRFPTT